MRYRPPALILTGTILGFLVVMQSRSFQDVQDIYKRDTRANVFHEIQVLKRTNENLQDEVTGLIDQLAKVSNQEQALNAIEDEIKKNRILAGYFDITGIGIEVTVKKEVPVIWLTDIVNELWNAGAEAISVNNIRLTNATVGFDTLPSGQISLHGVILQLPYTFQAIGNTKVLGESMKQQQGILERLKESIPLVEVVLEEKKEIVMKKIL